MKLYREIEPGELSQAELKRYIASFEEFPPRTAELQRQIGIGVGYHRAWYRSFKECWLGWLTAKDCELRKEDLNPSRAAAETRWNHLLNSPLMFWVAESANMSDQFLVAAKAAAEAAAEENPRSGHPHGRYMRQALPWSDVEQAILSCPEPVALEDAEHASLLAFRRLCERRSEFKKLERWLPVNS